MTTEHRNLYEDLIQGMIMEGINGMTPELLDIIKNAPTEDKRSMILDIMEDNNPEHRLLCEKIHNIMKRQIIGEVDHIKEVVKMLREYVKVSDVEVKKYGEIMTPIELVEEMLDTLPHTAWMSPNLKWLDPCNGVGTFISVVVERLMKGLEWCYPNEEERYRHIMEDMIYVCELQPKNVFLYMYAFDPKDQYALNIYNGSYLTEGFNKHMAMLGVDKFDVIVMNPPYNSDSNTNKSTGHSLWDKFVVKTINNLNENGYLVAVHPGAWRGAGKKTNDVRTLMLSKQIEYLELHSVEDGLKTFGAQTRYDWYCLKNIDNCLPTKIKDYDGKVVRVQTNKLPFIPNKNIESILSLVAKNGEETVNILRTCKYHTQKEYVSDVQTDEFKYPCVYSINKDGKLNLKWSNTNNLGHFGQPKFIFTSGDIRSIDFCIDRNGEYGMTEFAKGIIDDPKNFEHIYKAFRSDKFKELVKSCSMSLTEINKNIIATFRKDFWKEFI